MIEHGRRRVLHWNVTEHPTSEWVIQQLRETFPYDTAPKYLISDRDAVFSDRVFNTVRSFGTQPVRISYRCPWQNGVAERWIGSCRQEMLDHVIVFGEEHLRSLLRDYVAYHNEDEPITVWTKISWGQKTPGARSASEPPFLARILRFNPF